MVVNCFADLSFTKLTKLVKMTPIFDTSLFQVSNCLFPPYIFSRSEKFLTEKKFTSLILNIKSTNALNHRIKQSHIILRSKADTKKNIP